MVGAKRLLARLVAIVVVLFLAYLGGVNLLLALPATQARLNALAPERLAIRWQRAWSWYPPRVELRGLGMDGQTPGQQWQVESARAAASVSLPALLAGHVRVYDIDLTDVDLRLRPRPKAGAGDAPARAFYPEIPHRDPDAVAGAAPVQARPKPGASPGPALFIRIQDLALRGDHRVWIADLRAELSGELKGSLALDLARNRLGLDRGFIDMTLTALRLRDVPDPTRGARIRGSIQVPPTPLDQLKDRDRLSAIELDAEIDLPVQNLEFLRVLAGDLGDLDLRGRGRLRGRLHQTDGNLSVNTDLRVAASELALALPPYAFRGDGEVRFRIRPDAPDRAELGVVFGKVRGELTEGNGEASQVLFEGRALRALMLVRVAEAQTAGASPFSGASLDIPEVRVPDLSAYRTLIPEKSGLELRGGKGMLTAQLSLSTDALALDLDLAAEAADLGFRDYLGSSSLRLLLKARATAATAAALDLAGTRFEMIDTRLRKLGPKGEPMDAGNATAEPWDARLAVEQGNLRLPQAQTEDAGSPLAGLADRLLRDGLGPLLGRSHGGLSARLTVSQLDWIAALLGRPLGLQLQGRGEVATRIDLMEGLPGPGTRLEVAPKDLGLVLLDHVIQGAGQAVLSIEVERDQPELHLDLRLSDARARRLDEPEFVLDRVALDASIRVPQDREAAVARARVDLEIPSGRIRDMTAFNAYLPENTPITVASGSAALLGELHLGPSRTQGKWLLTADDIHLALDELAIAGNLRVGVLITGGSPEDMRFEVSGSSVTLSQVKVTGDTATYDQADWYARLQLGETELTWTKPLALDMQGAIVVKDTRPFVAALANARGEHSWIDDLLRVTDIAGTIDLSIDATGAVLHNARLGGDPIGIRAKGLSAPGHREALLFVRRRNLAGALALDDAKRTFSILGARQRFDDYIPGQTALPSRGIALPAAKDDQPEQATAATRPAVEPSASRRANAPAESPTDKPAKREPKASPFLDGDL